MTLIATYPSKKELTQNVGKGLLYIETSIFDMEYRSNGTLTVANRPHITNMGREWFAQVTMKDDKIVSVT